MPRPGTLWLVGTPIGNLKDLSERAREVLARVDVIACEDTRTTRKLMGLVGIRPTRLLSFYEGNERRRMSQVLGHLRDGWDVALVTDAGMPALSDPGYRLVAAAAEEGLAVDAVPGPTAAVTALVLSGLPTDRFAFEGFLSRKAGARRARLEEIRDERRTLVFYESPRRLAGLLADAASVLGDRRAALCRELTKLHQEVSRSTLRELAERTAEVRGEVVLVVEGAPDAGGPDLAPLSEHVDRLVAGGMSRRDAVAAVAEESGASKNALYEASLHMEG
ncbi:MAG TPA: 16S rRNA (cytidine(1402)-2'-O)-methyltransferase [Actinomycetota bacterium]